MGPESRQMSNVQLSGLEKAAALLLIMGKDSASKLAGYFSAEEIKKLSSTVGKFDSLNPETVNSVVSEFQENYLSMGILAKPDTITSLFEDTKKMRIQTTRCLRWTGRRTAHRKMLPRLNR